MVLLKLPEENNLKAHLHSNRAHCWVQLYEPTKVVQECTETLTLEPNNTKALLRRGFAYESLDKMRFALEDFQKVMMLDPSATKAVHAASRVKEALKRMGKSVD
jgi:regulator of sirC expression with transglutaminase-like and TPR domain